MSFRRTIYGFFKSILRGKQQGVSQPNFDIIERYILPYIGLGASINLVDIGAHNGTFIDDIAKYYNIVNAVLAEPIPTLAKELTNKYFGKGYFIFENVIADKEDEQIDFYINEFTPTSSILKIDEQMEELSNINTQLIEKVTVKTRTLDGIIKERNFPKIDLLKIDVQGSEHLVIEGGKNTLEQTKYVWIELSLKPLYNGSSIYHEVITLLNERGFILLELSPGYRSAKRELLQVDALFANTKLVR